MGFVGYAQCACVERGERGHNLDESRFVSRQQGVLIGKAGRFAGQYLHRRKRPLFATHALVLAGPSGSVQNQLRLVQRTSADNGRQFPAASIHNRSQAAESRGINRARCKAGCSR